MDFHPRLTILPDAQFFLMYIFIYAFGCAGSYTADLKLQPTGFFFFFFEDNWFIMLLVSAVQQRESAISIRNPLPCEPPSHPSTPPL